MTSHHTNRRTIALLAVVALVALTGCGAGGNSSGAGGSDGSMGQASGADGGSGPQSALNSYYSGDGERVVVRESTITVRVGNYTRAFRTARAVVARNGGYVGDRSQDSEGEWDTGTLTIKVPAQNFSAVRDRLAGLGYVEDESVTVADFSEEYDERAARIEDLEQEEASLERLLQQAEDPDEADRIRADLRNVREELRSNRGDQQSLNRRAALSTITLSLHEPVTRKPPENYRASFGFDDAFLQAFYGGLQVVKYVVVLFGYVVPLGIALVLLSGFTLGLVASMRRLREAIPPVLRLGAPAAREAPGTTAAGDTAADHSGEQPGEQSDEDGED